MTTPKTPIWLTILNCLSVADLRYREARKLKSLSEEHLADMGITRADADRAFLRDRYSRPVDHTALPLSHRA